MGDARALYLSDLAYIARLLRGQEDLLYSLEQGIGMNLIATHGGLPNPANVIAVLFDVTDYPAMYSWLMAIDMSVCGLTMFHFLRSEYGAYVEGLAFSTAYALMGFTVANCFQYNFMLSAELLPLIALGIRRLLRGECLWLYVVALGYSVFTSFYFGYMLAIASCVMALAWHYGQEPNKRLPTKWVALRFAVATVSAVLVGCVTLVPALLSLRGGRLEQNSPLDLMTLGENFGILDPLAKLFAGANDVSELVNGLPNVFCGSLALFLAVAFFMDEHTERRERISHAIPLAFYYLTFYVRALSMAMQGFSDTNWFNYRYSFVFSFFVIITASEEFQKFRDINARDVRRSLLVFAAIVVGSFATVRQFADGGAMLIDVVVLILCLGSIWWGRVNPAKAPSGQVAAMLVLLCSMELYANYLLCTSKILDSTARADEYVESTFYASAIADGVQGGDSDLYRMTSEPATIERCNNDPRLFGYYGVDYFGSCEKHFVFQGLSRLGEPWWSNRMWYAEGLPTSFDALMGVRYVTTKRDLAEEKCYAQTLTTDGGTVYQNELALPLATRASGQEVLGELSGDPFQNHNSVWSSLSGGEEEVFLEERDVTFTLREGYAGSSVTADEAANYSASLSASFGDGNEETVPQQVGQGGAETPADRRMQWIECSFTASRDGTVYSYNGFPVDDVTGYTMEPMRCLGRFRTGDKVSDVIELDSDINLEALNLICADYRVAYANDDVLAGYAKLLQNRSGTIEKITDSHLVGHVDSAEPGRMFFTMPYDEGWTMRVDGEEVPLTMEAGLFMSALMPAGEHDWELTFLPVGLRAGAAMSGVGVLVAGGLAAYDRKSQKDKDQEEQDGGKAK